MLSVGQGYLYRHIVSTKFIIFVTFLSSYFVNLDHLVTGLIVITSFISKGCFPFLHILKGGIESTKSLFRGFSPTNLVGTLPYFFGLLITLAQVTLFDLLSDRFYYFSPE